MANGTIARRAVVLGSGMAGLFAAGVVSDHVDQVVVIDRDDVPDGPSTDAGIPATRNGVPQGKHFHALLPGGLNIARELFPGFDRDLESVGAVKCVAGRDFFAYRPEGKSYSLGTYQPEPKPLGTLFFMSRGLLEHCVRRRVEALPNVDTHYRSLVREPLTDDRRVTGVVLEGGQRVPADLVIDATGKNSCSVRWLPALGFEPPAESVVNCDFAYASAVLRPPDPDAIGGAGFFVLPNPDGPYSLRGAYLVRIEGDVWLAGLGGRFGDYPPTAIEEWRQFGRTLAWPIWDELVDTAEMLVPPAPFRFPRSVRRHFERLEDFPEGLLPIGDAVCYYNPLYGQGMSAAACQAVALRGILERRRAGSGDTAGLALEFFPEAYEVTRTPWALAAATDFMDARTTGDFPSEEMQALAMLAFVMARADADPEALDLVSDIMTLVRPLSALLEPPWPERLAQGAQGAAEPAAPAEL